MLRRSGDRRWRPRRSSRPQRAAASASSGSGAGSVRGRLGPRCAAWRRCRRTPGRRAAAAEGPRSPPPTSPRPCSGRNSGAARRPVRPRRTPASDADGDRRSAPSKPVVAGMLGDLVSVPRMFCSLRTAAVVAAHSFTRPRRSHSVTTSNHRAGSVPTCSAPGLPRPDTEQQARDAYHWNKPLQWQRHPSFSQRWLRGTTPARCRGRLDGGSASGGPRVADVS